MRTTHACTPEETVDFWARRFAEQWYRGQGHLANDFRRFVAVHRVPTDAQSAVCERAQELLLGLPCAPHAA